jgi:hypothetical protein
LVLAAADAEQRYLLAQGRRQLRVERGVQLLLDVTHRDGGAAREALGPDPHGLVEVRGGHDAVHETPLFSLRRRQRVTEERELFGPGQAHEAG